MERRETVLVVEDRVLDREAMRLYCDALGLECVLASNVDEALALSRSHDPFDFASVDLHLAKGETSASGLGLIAALRTHLPGTPIIAVSSDPRLSTWQDAQQAGASICLRKPILSAEELAAAFETASQKRWYEESSDARSALRHLPPSFVADHPEGLVLDPQMVSVIKRVASDASVPLLVCGEPGTGKDEIARLLHRYRTERGGTLPFVKVDCRYADEASLLRRLFGHVAAQGEAASAPASLGSLALAMGGILYLDNVDELPREVQAELARALEVGMYDRGGDRKPMVSSFQLVCSASLPRDRAVASGRIHPDLAARFVGPEIRLLPLRMRTFELKALVRLLLARKGLAPADACVAAIADHCRRFYWQGNIRELHSALGVFLLLNDNVLGGRLDFAKFPTSATMFPPKEPEPEGAAHGAPHVMTRALAHAMAHGMGHTGVPTLPSHAMAMPSGMSPGPGGSDVSGPFASASAAAAASAAATHPGGTGSEAPTPKGAVRVARGTEGAPLDDEALYGLQGHPALRILADALRRDVPIYETMAHVERLVLAEAIRRHGMNMSHVSASLRIPRSTLNLKRRQHDLP